MFQVNHLTGFDVGKRGMSFEGFLGNTETTGSITIATHAVTSAVPAGNTVVVAVGNDSNTETPTSVTDDRSNTYTLIESETGGSDGSVFIYRSTLDTALQLNDEITVTFGTGGKEVGVAAFELSGKESGNTSGSASGSSSSPSATTAGSAPAKAIAIGIVVADKAPTWTQPAGWTEDVDTIITQDSYTVAHDLVTASGTVTYNPTQSASQPWACAVVAFW